MSNPVVLETKEFKNKHGEISHGYTLSDCYEQCYDDTLESNIDDDLQLLT